MSIATSILMYIHIYVWTCEFVTQVRDSRVRGSTSKESAHA